MELIGILMGLLFALAANALPPVKKNGDSTAFVSKVRGLHFNAQARFR